MRNTLCAGAVVLPGETHLDRAYSERAQDRAR
jgi:hypothetical protein